MRVSLPLVVVWVAASFVIGCPGPGGGEGEGEGNEGEGEGDGPPTPVDLGCTLDEECGSGLVCDRDSGDCVAGLDCSANPGACEFCGDPTIIPPLECGFDEGPAYCDADAGVCRRQRLACEPCSEDAQCADSAAGLASVCADGFCATGCGACPVGFVCQEGGCIPAGGSERCDGAIACRDGTSCPDGQQCTALGVCLEVCSTDADCALGTVCETQPGPTQGQCRAGCDPVGDTRIEDGVEKVCHADGHFREYCPTAPCPTGTECDGDGICQRTGCIDDTDCPLIRTYCDVGQGVCVDGCNDPSDCGAFEECNFTDGVGACVAQGCRGKDLSCELGQWCCGAEAFDNPSSCPATVEEGQCFYAPDPWCRACESDEDCANIDEFGQASYCYELQDAEGASLGKFCSVGCNSNADCPRGVDCILDLPTPTEGVTTQGCMDSLCPLISQTH
jgi:hypothetical protein